MAMPPPPPPPMSGPSMGGPSMGGPPMGGPPMGGPPMGDRPPGVVDVENGNIYYEEKPPNTAFVVFMNITNTITHLLIGAVVCIAITFANIISLVNIWSDTFHIHIYMCVIGYIVLMSQAIMSMSPQSSWTQNLKQDHKTAVHYVMQITGSILAVVGSIIRIADLNTHFNSAHAVLGIVAMVFTIFSLIGGVVNLFGTSLIPNPVFIKIAHSLVGTLTIFIAYLSLIFAFDDWRFRGTFGNSNANLAMVFAILALIGVLLSPTVTSVKRIIKW